MDQIQKQLEAIRAEITPKSLALFMAYVKDAGNWNGNRASIGTALNE